MAAQLVASRVVLSSTELISYKSPCSDQILTKLIQAGGEKLVSAILKFIKPIWNKKEFPDQWKESIIVPIHEMIINLIGIIIMDVTIRNFIHRFIEHSSLGFSLYVEGITGDYQCGFGHSSSITDHIF
jgi:hypothetical protein